jgi:hypothetical protein
MLSLLSSGLLLIVTFNVVFVQGGKSFINRICFSMIFVCCFVLEPLPSESSDGTPMFKKDITTCGNDEEYGNCGSTCPPHCTDFSYPHKLKICTLQCIKGCFCKKGLYRTENGKCVKPHECCNGQNELYKKCGTKCPETCDSGTQICDKQCVPGCFCKPNFIRKDNSTNSLCIERSKC